MFKKRQRYKPHNPPLEQTHFNTVGDFNTYNLVVELFSQVGELKGQMKIVVGFMLVIATAVGGLVMLLLKQGSF